MIDRDVLVANLATIAVLLPIAHFIMHIDGLFFWIGLIGGEAVWIRHEWRKPKVKASNWNPKEKVKEFINNGRIEKDAV